MKSSRYRLLHWTFIRLLCLAVSLVASVHAAEGEIDFAREVQPIFAQHCLECHGPDTQEGSLRLDQRTSVTAEADSGEVPVVPGDAAASELLKRITSTDPDVRMPPEGERIAPKDIETIRQWIVEGANYSEHWAYRPLRSPTLPVVNNEAWCRTPIDYFVLSKLEQQNIEPSPPADCATLIKRIYYDLLGIPPSTDAVDRFIGDQSPIAYENLVDRLLASPRFGERWGRHWLDKARYADSDGYEKDNPRPNAWLYRDWVIRSINADQPFDAFTIEQLAGDLLPSATPHQKLATAFHRQTLTNTEGGTDKEQWRVAAVMDRTETLGAVWLGLTVGCARCHNHKYDQISQDEYYQLFAFFNNGDETNFELPARELWKRLLQKKTKVRVVTQRTKDPRKTRVLRRGEFLEPQHEVVANTLATLPDFESRHSDGSIADRLDLAQWLMSGDNPLPPRVAANHVWKNLFGKGIVRTVNDFGIRGEPPTHPQLLDYLAAIFQRNGWSRKSLVRAIVTSSTYRQSSTYRVNLQDVDPNNRLLHRQNRFRVEAEIVRDIALAASGMLSDRVGGQSVFPPIPASVTDLTYNSSFKWKTSQADDRYRRGMYTFFKRTAPHPNLTTFDCPTSNVTCVERDSSNTPIGALVTLNNQVYVEAAVAFAKLVLTQSPSSRQDRVTFAIRRCIARKPTAEEVQHFDQLIEKAAAYYTSHGDEAKSLVGIDNAELAAWTVATRVMLNLDEFITRE